MCLVLNLVAYIIIRVVVGVLVDTNSGDKLAPSGAFDNLLEAIWYFTKSTHIPEVAPQKTRTLSPNAGYIYLEEGTIPTDIGILRHL
jgi:hypothetical protein